MTDELDVKKANGYKDMFKEAGIKRLGKSPLLKMLEAQPLMPKKHDWSKYYTKGQTPTKGKANFGIDPGRKSGDVMATKTIHGFEITNTFIDEADTISDHTLDAARYMMAGVSTRLDEDIDDLLYEAMTGIKTWRPERDKYKPPKSDCATPALLQHIKEKPY